MEKKEQDGYGTSMEEFAGKIFSDPSQWVLFLGDGISYDKQNSCQRQLFYLAKEACQADGKDFLIKEKIYEAIQKEDYLKLSGTMFGDMWDGAVFLDEIEEERIKWREKYADRLAKREEINISKAHVDLANILQVFPGMIITTCQDETIEAFLEYEMSRPVDDIVYTPYLLAISDDWEKWVNGERVKYMNTGWNEEHQENMRLLVKLYGSRRHPYRMLLSEKDVRECYSEGENPKKFLKGILETKNLFFLGMDFGKKGPLSYGKEIEELLKIPPVNAERYAFDEKEIESSQLKKYHVKQIRMETGEKTIEKFSYKLKEERKKREKAAGNVKRPSGNTSSGEKPEGRTKQEEKFMNENAALTWEAAKEQFAYYYNRRSCKDLLEEGEEKDILKKEILGFGENSETKKKWSRKSLKQLAVAANNVADFYDLKDIFRQAEVFCLTEEKEAGKCGRNSDQFYEIVTRKMLDDRLGEKSRELHQILLLYGDGFPVGFLWLLSADDDDLKEWKRAGIQLTGSGIYMKRQRRKNLHERMFHADNIMKTAGTNPYKKMFRNRIKEVSHQLGDSYFYPLNNELISEESEKIEKKHFKNMFKKMHDILRDKSVGYKQLHSLLQTEMPEIIKNMGKLAEAGKENEEIQWRPALLYYLLNESRAIPKDCTELKRQIEELSKIAENNMNNGNETGRIKALADWLMLVQTKSLIKCQSEVEVTGDQNEAIETCSEAEQKVEEQHWWKENSEPEEIFKQRVHISLLKVKIFGRRSSILEIERCKNEDPECDKQESMLEEMGDELKNAEKMMREGKKISGNSYDEEIAEWNHLMGEYYFKKSQFYWENRRYGKIENESEDEPRCYKKAEEFYKDALAYYGKYPDKFEVQRADVMRSMADLYCQKRKSTEEADGKEEMELKEKCYNMLIEAYCLYRINGDLHGIADVLQSMGNAEDFYEVGEKNRSPLCFYKVSSDLYQELNDSWSFSVVKRFYETAIEMAATAKRY